MHPSIHLTKEPIRIQVPRSTFLPYQLVSMLSATLVRLSVRSAVSLRSPLTARFAVSTKQHKATLPFRSFASAASTTRTKSAPSTRKKPASAAGATKKSTRSKSTASTKKKAAAPKKAPKPKKEKLKPWQARGADGKMRESSSLFLPFPFPLYSCFSFWLDRADKHP